MDLTPYRWAFTEDRYITLLDEGVAGLTILVQRRFVPDGEPVLNQAFVLSSHFRGYLAVNGAPIAMDDHDAYAGLLAEAAALGILGVAYVNGPDEDPGDYTGGVR